MRSVFAKYVLVPCLIGFLIVLGIEAAVRSDTAVGFVDAHRPATAPTRVQVEKQLWHLEALARTRRDRVAIVGSSSVVNGIDIAALGKQLRERNYPLEPQNLGLTGLLAYELPLLKEVILTERTKRVVYLYNLWSFADQVNPTAVDSRWHLGEMLRLKPLTWWDPASFAVTLDRTMANALWLTKYRSLLKELAWRALTGELAVLTTPYDYPADAPAPPAERPRVMEPPLAPNASILWLRAAYTASTERPQSMGYRGLERFCELARERGIPVLIAPVVEPDFNRYSAYAQGTDRDAVDRTVAAIAKRCGAQFVARDRFRQLESRDGLFRDFVHLYDTGRDVYTPMVGEMILGQ